MISEAMQQGDANAEKVREFYRSQGEVRERNRIIDLLLEQNIVRRCGATNKLVAFETTGEEVVYIKDLEKSK